MVSPAAIQDFRLKTTFDLTEFGAPPSTASAAMRANMATLQSYVELARNRRIHEIPKMVYDRRPTFYDALANPTLKSSKTDAEMEDYNTKIAELEAIRPEDQPATPKKVIRTASDLTVFGFTPLTNGEKIEKETAPGDL